MPTPAALVALSDDTGGEDPGQILRRRDSLGNDDSNSEMARMLTCAYFRSCTSVVIGGLLCAG
jgi:hypothetical protein